MSIPSCLVFEVQALVIHAHDALWKPFAEPWVVCDFQDSSPPMGVRHQYSAEEAAQLWCGIHVWGNDPVCRPDALSDQPIPA